MIHDVCLSLGPVTLRPVDPRDAVAVGGWLEPPMWNGMATPFPDIHALEQLIQSQIDSPTVQGFGVELNGEVIGLTTYYDMAAWKLEVGSTIYARRVWGGIVNPICKLLLLGHAFDNMGMARVSLRCDARNDRSARAIERLGAAYEGTLRQFRPAADGTLADIRYYSILPAEWPGVRAGLMSRVEAVTA